MRLCMVCQVVLLATRRGAPYTGSVTAIILWGIVGTFALAWAAHLLWPEKGAKLWVRLASISAALVFVFGLWGLIGYGANLMRWFRK